MVFFTCNQCGSCLKKPQVDKHRFQCRAAGGFSCMDCHKDFRGDEYKSHIKCVSEEEKYSGLGWKPPPGHMKGEKKQMGWTETIRMVSSDAKLISHLDASTRRLLSDLTKHDNIPRKKPKFMNFIKNTTRNRFDEAAFEKVWAVLETQMTKSQPKNEKQSATPTPTCSQSSNGDVATEEVTEESTNGLSENKPKKKKSKRKEESTFVDQEEMVATEQQTSEELLENSPKKKKSKKSKRKEELDAVEQEVVVEVLENKSKKKKSKRMEEDIDQPVLEESLDNEPKKKKSKRKDKDIDEPVLEENLEIKPKKKKSKKREEDIDQPILEETLDKEPKKKKSKRKNEDIYPLVLEENGDNSPKKKKSKRRENSDQSNLEA